MSWHARENLHVYVVITVSIDSSQKYGSQFKLKVIMANIFGISKVYIAINMWNRIRRCIQKLSDW